MREDDQPATPLNPSIPEPVDDVKGQVNDAACSLWTVLGRGLCDYRGC
jgi:hypothetical protein